MKRILSLVFILAIAASLWADSLVELSRREKARREGLQGKHAKVVTNEDLAVVRKSIAVISLPDSALESSGQAALNTKIPGKSNLPGSKSAPAIVMVPTVAKDGPPLFKDNLGASGGSLESRYKAAHDLVDLLTTKMNALWQEFYNMNTMNTQDAIQLQIDETYKKLNKAQEEEDRLKAELEKSKGMPQRENR